MSPRRLLSFAGYAALGPITGPLVAGVVRNLRLGHPVLAGLYVVALGVCWFDLAGLAARTALWLI